MSHRAIVMFILAASGCDSDPPGLVVPPALVVPGSEPDPDPPGTIRRPAIMLDDFEGDLGGPIPAMWQLNGSPGASLVMATTAPARAASLLALHVLPEPTATGADVFTHHHFDWTQTFAGVRFWVRTDALAGAEVGVAVTGTVSETHDQALAAGRPWLLARASAGPEWAQVTLRFDKLMPEGPGKPQATTDGGLVGVSELHFLAPDNGASGVWLDDIELLCAGAGCLSAL